MALCFAYSSELALRPPPEFRPWQLITYAFAHGSIWHLLLNGLALAGFGFGVERIAGSWNMALILAVGILAGAITLMDRPMMGMSAGIFAVIAFFCLHKPGARVYLLVFPMRAMDLFVLCVIVSAVLAMAGVWGGIAHMAHLTGMAGGVLCYYQWERVQRDT